MDNIITEGDPIIWKRTCWEKSIMRIVAGQVNMSGYNFHPDLQLHGGYDSQQIYSEPQAVAGRQDLLATGQKVIGCRLGKIWL